MKTIPTPSLSVSDFTLGQSLAAAFAYCRVDQLKSVRKVSRRVVFDELSGFRCVLLQLSLDLRSIFAVLVLRRCLSLQLGHVRKRRFG